MLTLFLLFGCHGRPPAIAATPEKPAWAESQRMVSAVGFCRLSTEGELVCKQMHPGEPTYPLFPERPPGRHQAILQAMGTHCTLSEAGAIACWGRGEMPGPFVEMGRFQDNVCGLTADGDVHCLVLQRHPVAFSLSKGLAVKAPGSGYTDLHGGIALCLSREDGFRCFRPVKGATEAGEVFSKSTEGEGTFTDLQWLFGLYCGIDQAGQTSCFSSTKVPRQGVFGPEPVDALVPESPCAVRDRRVVCHRLTPGGWAPDVPAAEVRDLTMAGSPGRQRLVGLSLDGEILDPHGQVELEGPFVDVEAQHADLCARRPDDSVACQYLGLGGPKDNLWFDERWLRTSSVEATEHRLGLDAADWVVSDFHAKQDRQNEVYGRGDKPKVSRPDLNDVQDAGSFGCGLEEDGKAVCWGHQGGIQLRPPTERLTQLALGSVFACGILQRDASAACWGTTYFHHQQTPEGPFAELRTSRLSVCGERTNGTVTCWGAAWMETFEVPFVPHDWALLGAGVCAIPAPDTDVQCFGNGFRM